METADAAETTETETATPGVRATERDRERAFAALVASHRDRAIGLAWRLVGGDASAAEDVVQDAFVRAWRALPGFRADAEMSTWFYRIVVRQAANHRRWRAVRDRFLRDRAAEPVGSLAPPGADPVLRRRIAEALAALPRLQREAFVLVTLEGFSAREAAGIMGRAEGTVKSHLHRARTALRTKLADLAEPAATASANGADRSRTGAAADAPGDLRGDIDGAPAGAAAPPPVTAPTPLTPPAPHARPTRGAPRAGAIREEPRR